MGEGGEGRIVRCPVCMDFIRWPSADSVYMWRAGQPPYVQESLVGLDDEARASARRLGYQRCENPSGGPDAPPHYLPAMYAEYKEPLVVGLVGGSQAGKTHLLTAMFREIRRGGLAPYDLEAEPLDFVKDEQFTEEFLVKFEKHLELDGTESGVLDFAVSLLVRGPGWARPVVFFDVAGEDLRAVDNTDRGGRFLIAIGAVLFVHAPDDELALEELGRQSVSVRSRRDQAMRLSLAKIKASSKGRASVPAAVAVTKADRLRFRPPADFWLRRGAEQALDAARVRAESRDVFAYLSEAGEAAAMAPYTAFDRCTLHFVSATGGDSKDRDFQRGVHPMRVLEPLVSIFAMAGMIPGPEAAKVGAP